LANEDFQLIPNGQDRKRINRAYNRHNENLDSWNKMIKNVQAVRDSTANINERTVKAAKRTLIEL